MNYDSGKVQPNSEFIYKERIEEMVWVYYRLAQGLSDAELGAPVAVALQHCRQAFEPVRLSK